MEKGIARIIYVFGELTKMEAAISTVIAKSKVPTKEIRILLKSYNRLQAERTPLFQYMRNFFRDIGLGDLRCAKIDPFSISFSVYNSKIPKLFSDTKGKTCYVTADALKMFFEKDMGIVVEVSETKCVNEGEDHCEFEVVMNPPDVLKYVIENEDLEILKKLKENPESKVEDTLRLSNLERYGLVKNGKITILGEKYMELGVSPEVVEVERPWKKLSEISEVTASAKSFAEAFSRSIDEDVEEVDEETLVNVVEETEKSKSFAELVAKFMKKEVKDNE